MKINLSKLLCVVADVTSINKKDLKVQAYYRDNEEEHPNKNPSESSMKWFLASQYRLLPDTDKNISISISYKDCEIFYFEAAGIVPEIDSEIFNCLSYKFRKDADVGDFYGFYPYFYIDNFSKPHNANYKKFAQIAEIDTDKVYNIFSPNELLDNYDLKQEDIKTLTSLVKTDLDEHFFKNLPDFEDNYNSKLKK